MLDPVVVDSGTSSDHYFIAFQCNISFMPSTPPEPITYRNIKNIELDAFVEDILTSELCDSDCFINLENAVDLYENKLKSILDKHAPEKRLFLRKSQKNGGQVTVKRPKQ